ncbi:hypothetical protein FB45DRAFT_741229 [Roridomyces roridus]|uniref:Uncharacterized protein n=1 Tax=Roridomyces roridus TaxID=1738132 RepID=A0AAD7C590_9AGAR|nr:hypothetical protein FB45DRAFT_741229 [Roridomyces roridus]
MSFIFAPSDAKIPRTARKIHIRRLYDVMNVSIQRNDLERATRAWCILARCKEINWTAMWSTSVHLLANHLEERQRAEQKIAFLRVMMLQSSSERETILKELILRLVISGQHREALDELELYLPSFPYQDNALLHIYAGLITLYLAQPSSQGSPFNTTFLRNARGFFDRAKTLDSGNETIAAFLQKIDQLDGTRAKSADDSDEDIMDTSGAPERKRIRN